MPLRARLIQASILALLAAVCAAVILTTPSTSPERVVAAFLVTLALPGAALTALLPAAEGRGPAERLALIFALSIAATILVSAGLYVVGIKLDLHSWTIALCGVTVVCAVASAWVPGPPVLPASVGLHRLRAPLVVAVVAVGGVLTSAAIVTAHSVSGRNGRDHFTQLWATPTGARRARIGIYNHEGGRRTYTLRVSTNTGPVRAERVELGDAKSFTTEQTVPPRATRLLVTISSSGSPAAVYRWVQLRYPSRSR